MSVRETYPKGPQAARQRAKPGSLRQTMSARVSALHRFIGSHGGVSLARLKRPIARTPFRRHRVSFAFCSGTVMVVA